MPATKSFPIVGGYVSSYENPFQGTPDGTPPGYALKVAQAMKQAAAQATVVDENTIRTLHGVVLVAQNGAIGIYKGAHVVSVQVDEIEQVITALRQLAGRARQGTAPANNMAPLP